LPIIQHPDLLVGTETGDDAAVFRLRDDLALVQTVDFFPPIVDDPWQFGAIAVSNAVSDVYAMGGTPLLALNLVCFPSGLPKEILQDILKGGAEKANEAHLLIVGGHTIEDDEPKYGMAVTGIVDPKKYITNAAARPGDHLILTKPIGTGIITTAAKSDRTTPEAIQRALDVMLHLNKASSEAMMTVGVSACTDVTGFGLVGHLRAMMQASGTSACISLQSVPVIEGTWELVESDVVPGGTRRNYDVAQSLTRWHSSIANHAQLLLCDAQTSGGLLISVPSGRTEQLLRALHERGEEGVMIGEVSEEADVPLEVRP
jgi:selenium donor protein